MFYFQAEVSKKESVQSRGSSISSQHNSSTESIPGATASKHNERTEIATNHDKEKDDDVISLFTPKKVVTATMASYSYNQVLRFHVTS